MNFEWRLLTQKPVKEETRKGHIQVKNVHLGSFLIFF